MKKTFPLFSIFLLFVFLTATTSYANHRYHYPRHTRYYNHRNYYHPHSYYYSNSDSFWTGLGVGVIASVIIGSILYETSRPSTVVYHRPQPKTIYLQPITTWQQSNPVPQIDPVLKQVKITSKILNVRTLPDMNSTISRQIQQGDTVGVIGAAPEWLYIKTNGGNHGWIKTMFTTETDFPSG